MSITTIMNNKENKYLKFTNLAIQMGLIIGLGTYFGQYLDLKFENSYKLWTIIFSLFSISAALYQVFKSIKK